MNSFRCGIARGVLPGGYHYTPVGCFCADPEINQNRDQLLRVHHNIGWLDIPVYNSETVDGIDGFNQGWNYPGFKLFKTEGYAAGKNPIKTFSTAACSNCKGEAVGFSVTYNFRQSCNIQSGKFLQD